MTEPDWGVWMHDLMRELYPLPRSLTGNGVRQTLDVIGRELTLELTEVPSGTQVYDWTVPREWNVREAWLADPSGRRVADFAESNLHLLAYSVPMRARMPLAQLRPHLFSDPERPTVVPFRTSYHHENWGFCIRHDELERLPEGEYQIVIDTTLEPGHLTYAECVLRGTSGEEILFSTYIDHPSLCNDNLSGVVLTAALAKAVAKRTRRHTYRFLFSPATLGPLCWLAANEDRLGRIRAGLVASCVGDGGDMTYKRSRRGDALVDRAVEHVLRHSGAPFELRDFSPLGGDERQFCSPGFDLPVGSLSRSPADEFPGYHSSADDLELVRPEFLADSLGRYLAVVEVLEGNAAYLNLNPKGEPQLGRRGLYRQVGGGSFSEAPLLWVLNLSDGRHDLLTVAERSGMPFVKVRDAAETLLEQGLLAEAQSLERLRRPDVEERL
jgi:aminopeptidase-like protein